MIIVKKSDRPYMQCQSCETTKEVINISVSINDETGARQRSSIRLCLNCLAELNKQVENIAKEV